MRTFPRYIRLLLTCFARLGFCLPLNYRSGGRDEEPEFTLLIMRPDAGGQWSLGKEPVKMNPRRNDGGKAALFARFAEVGILRHWLYLC